MSISKYDFRDGFYVMKNPTTKVRLLDRGRVAYWDQSTRSIVIRSPKAIDGGTTFVPKNGTQYFLNEIN